MIKLNLGCGSDTIEGYDNIDVNPIAGGVIKCQSYAQLPYEPNSVNEIRAIYTLCKIPPIEVADVLRHWYNLLEPGGTISIELPEIVLIANRISFGPVDIGQYQDWIFGNNDRKSVFTIDTFKQLVTNLKFVVVEGGFQDITFWMKLRK